MSAASLSGASSIQNTLSASGKRIFTCVTPNSSLGDIYTKHCDKPGWPDCFDVGKAAAIPGTSCPSGHSANYCRGWEDGAGSSGDGSSRDDGFSRDSGSSRNPSSIPSEGKTLEDYCVQYHSLIGKTEADCHDMVHGDDIQGSGAVFLLCNLVKLAGVHVTGGLSILARC